MKNRDEYLESIYKKRDTTVRQRKKHITAVATLVSLCFVLIIGISALSVSFFSMKSSDEAEFENIGNDDFQQMTDEYLPEDTENILNTEINDEDFADNHFSGNSYGSDVIAGNEAAHGSNVDGFTAESINDSICEATTVKSQANNTSTPVATVTLSDNPDYIREIYTDADKLLAALDPEDKLMLDFQAPNSYYVITFSDTGEIYYWTDGAACHNNDWYGIGRENNEIIKKLILV